MVRILILIMSCNQDFFNKSEQVIKDTYIQNIKNYSNVDYYFFTADKNERIDKDNHKIYVNTGDSWVETYQKNLRVFELLRDSQIEYDYIVRTNTSTYLNIPLLIGLCQYMTNIKDKHIYCGEINRYNNSNYPVGKCIIFNKYHISKILDTKIDITEDPDDYQYSKVFNDDNAYKLFKTVYYNYYSNYYLNETSFDTDIIKNNIALSYKSVQENRESEFDTAYKIHESIANYKYNSNDLISALTNVKLHIFDHNINKFIQ